MNLHIRHGEKVGIIGSSGAGKTTLLRLIAGEIEPSSGSIELDDRQLQSMSSTERFDMVGLMHQQLDLVPQLSARKNIEAGNSGRWSLLRTLIGLLLPVHDLRSTEIAEHLNITDHLDERTSRLSGGQQQRVALGRLMAQNPELMLLDEPVSSVDPALAERILEILCTVGPSSKSSTASVIASLHNPDLAARFFDRIIGMSRGVIVFDKPAPDVSSADIETVYGEMISGMSPDNADESEPVIWGRD